MFARLILRGKFFLIVKLNPCGHRVVSVFSNQVVEKKSVSRKSVIMNFNHDLKFINY